MKEHLTNAVKASTKHIVKTFGPGVALVCCGRMLYVHRNVIKAAVTGAEMPQAPAWHFWVKNRKEA